VDFTQPTVSYQSTEGEITNKSLRIAAGDSIRHFRFGLPRGHTSTPWPYQLERNFSPSHTPSGRESSRPVRAAPRRNADADVPFSITRIDKLLGALERGNRGHRGSPRKQWLRRLLDWDVRGSGL